VASQTRISACPVRELNATTPFQLLRWYPSVPIVSHAGAHLHHSFSCGRALALQKDALLALLQAGAAVDARDKDGWTPLHLSAEKGHTDALLALLQAGSAVDAKDNEGRTALDIAKRYQEAEVVAMLRAAGARE